MGWNNGNSERHNDKNGVGLQVYVLLNLLVLVGMTFFALLIKSALAFLLVFLSAVVCPIGMAGVRRKQVTMIKVYMSSLFVNTVFGITSGILLLFFHSNAGVFPLAYAVFTTIGVCLTRSFLKRIVQEAITGNSLQKEEEEAQTLVHNSFDQANTEQMVHVPHVQPSAPAQVPYFAEQQQAFNIQYPQYPVPMMYNGQPMHLQFVQAYPQMYIQNQIQKN